jgi:NADH:ubiquinone oxidoreductase subunit C
MTLLFFKSILSKSITAVQVKNHDLEIRVNSHNIYPILYFLQKHTACQFDCLTDIICYDTPGKYLRFGIVYNLLSVRYNTRVRLVTKFRDLVSLLSVSSIFSGAG